MISPRGQATLAAIKSDPAGTLLALDFDGTLSPIIDDPRDAYANPLAIEAVARLGSVLGHVAVVTGRPAEVALRLGGFERRVGLEKMVILGQYGVERWEASSGELTLPPEPKAITELEETLPGWLEQHGAGGAHIEHKGRALVVHTRALDDSGDTVDRLLAPLSELARRHDLVVEVGKNVLEMRSGGYDKGDAMRDLVAETGARQIVFAGDDLGDLPAYDAVDELASTGSPVMLICSASAEQDALVARADVVLEGPAGVADWLCLLADDLGA